MPNLKGHTWQINIQLQRVCSNFDFRIALQFIQILSGRKNQVWGTETKNKQAPHRSRPGETKQVSRLWNHWLNQKYLLNRAELSIIVLWVHTSFWVLQETTLLTPRLWWCYLSHPCSKKYIQFNCRVVVHFGNCSRSEGNFFLARHGN